MKKALLIMMIAVFTVFTVIGCDLQEEETNEATATPSPTKVEVKEKQMEFYVSLDGDDANPGTMDEPWRTFKKAVEEVQPGQTIYVLEGEYTERLVINTSGALNSPITFMAYPGHEVTINGERKHMKGWSGLITVDNQDYIRISGFRVINSPAMGIFACDGTDITIDNNYIYNTYSPGIHAWGDTNLLIEGNTLENTSNKEEAPLECLSLRRTENFVIRDNHVFDSGAIGIDSAESFNNGKIYNNVVHDTGLGIYLDGWDQYGSNVEVYDNLCYDNTTGFAVNAENGGTVEHIKVYNNIAYGNEADGFNVCWGGWLESSHTVKNLEMYNNISYNNGASGFAILGVRNGHVENVTLSNNISYNNTGAGITVSGVAKEPFEYTIKNINVINNTVFGNGTEGVWGSGGIYITNPDTSTGYMEGITVKNNIVSQNKLFTIALWKHGRAAVNVIIQNNLIDGYTYDANGYGETRGENYVEGNPLFLDAANADFKITADSPAIDAGTADGAPAEDFDGTARPQGAGIDIGAYEFK